MSLDAIANLKAQAKEIKIELGIKHQQALDEASRREGFHDYHHARKVLLNRPHQILFGIDSKYLIDLHKDFFIEHQLSVRHDYWESCYEAAAADLGHDVEIWQDENDWIALSTAPADVKSIKDAIDYVRALFFHPPEFILFDGILLDLTSYSSDDYVRFGFLQDDDEPDYFLPYLQEDFNI